MAKYTKEQAAKVAEIEEQIKEVQAQLAAAKDAQDEAAASEDAQGVVDVQAEVDSLTNRLKMLRDLLAKAQFIPAPITPAQKTISERFESLKAAHQEHADKAAAALNDKAAELSQLESELIEAQDAVDAMRAIELTDRIGKAKKEMAALRDMKRAVDDRPAYTVDDVHAAWEEYLDAFERDYISAVKDLAECADVYKAALSQLQTLAMTFDTVRDHARQMAGETDRLFPGAWDNRLNPRLPKDLVERAYATPRRTVAHFIADTYEGYRI